MTSPTHSHPPAAAPLPLLWPTVKPTVAPPVKTQCCDVSADCSPHTVPGSLYPAGQICPKLHHKGQEPAATSDTPPAGAYAFNLRPEPFCLLACLFFFFLFPRLPLASQSLQVSAITFLFVALCLSQREGKRFWCFHITFLWKTPGKENFMNRRAP